jgi:hypothetical protein
MSASWRENVVARLLQAAADSLGALKRRPGVAQRRRARTHPAPSEGFGDSKIFFLKKLPAADLEKWEALSARA